MVSSLNSQLHHLESICSKILQRLRALRNELVESEELEKEKENYYVSHSREMENFRAEAETYGVNCCLQLEELKARANELKLRFSKLQSSVNYSNSSEIALAEKKKNELLSEKENLDGILASNSQVKEQLRKQLKRVLEEQVQLRKT